MSPKQWTEVFLEVNGLAKDVGGLLSRAFAEFSEATRSEQDDSDSPLMELRALRGRVQAISFRRGGR